MLHEKKIDIDVPSPIRDLSDIFLCENNDLVSKISQNPPFLGFIVTVEESVPIGTENELAEPSVLVFFRCDILMLVAKEATIHVVVAAEFPIGKPCLI